MLKVLLVDIIYIFSKFLKSVKCVTPKQKKNCFDETEVLKYNKRIIALFVRVWLCGRQDVGPKRKTLNGGINSKRLLYSS